MATTSEDGNLVPVQLTVDFKPNLPRESSKKKSVREKLETIKRIAYVFFFWVDLLLAEEAERIIECKGRVFCLHDEPGVHRVWLPDEESPGLAMSRAFGDYCIKDYGLISVPEVTQRHITSSDQFVVLATDGVRAVLRLQ